MKKPRTISKSKKLGLGFASITSQDRLQKKHIAAHSAPIFASSTYIYESAEQARKVFSGDTESFIYSRWSHPNAELAESKIAQLETYGLSFAAQAYIFSSGMAAVAALYQSMLKTGDKILVQGNIYGTSVDFFNHFENQLGVDVIYADFKKLNELESILRAEKNVRLLYIETPSNPTLNCYDLRALSSLAKKYRVKTAVDNTFASPYLQQPFKFGIDFVIHSATKHLNGHGTGLSGFLIGKDVEWMQQVVWKVRKLNGSICAPFDSWLLNMGLKTLSLRMDQHCKNALQVAHFLQQHPAVSKVNYLGLKEHSDHRLAKKQMKNFGGVLSFEMKQGYKAGEKLMKKIKFCQLTASLGTIDTLIQHPASMSHSFVAKAQREEYGITDGLIRISVGVEDVNDILNDLAQALR